MKLKPYLGFNGCAEEAANYYAAILGGKIVEMNRYGDCMPDVPEVYKQKIIHLSLEFADNVIGMADVEPGSTAQYGSGGYCLTLHLDTIGQIEAVYAGLSDGGVIKCPLGETFYAKSYAELTDRFGISWALIIE